MKTIAFALLLFAATAQAQHARIVQTNSGSDTISLIDPATPSVVAEIQGVPVNPGAATAPMYPL